MKISLLLFTLLSASLSLADEIRATGYDTNGIVTLSKADPLILDCNVTMGGGGGAFTTTWYQDTAAGVGKQLESSGSIEVDGSRIVIHHPHYRHAGNYTCSVMIDGQLRNRTIHVVTEVNARIKENSININAGQNLTVSCATYGVPRPVVTWFKDNISLTEISDADIWTSAADGDDRVHVSADEDGVSQLVVRDLKLQGDLGQYCCRAESSSGVHSDCVTVRVLDPYGALWPCAGIAAEVLLLTIIIYACDRQSADSAKGSSDEDDSHKRK